MDHEEILGAEATLLVPTYARPDVVFERGEGVYLYDDAGRRYLDMMAGIAVNVLGYADREWADAVCAQARTLTHVSNLYHTEAHVALAQRLVTNSFADRVFFCNSGSEANEAALKFARKFARIRSAGDGSTGVRNKILAFTGSFHGRTMGALSVTAKARYREPFAPLIPGVAFAPFNDLEAAAAQIDKTTCAVIVEPVQGEGGVNPANESFLKGLRSLCDRHGALLIFDEVQCGLGRTGTLWAYQQYGIAPDIMTVAKPLAGGLPIGATLVSEEVARSLEPGDHGSTFAAGPLVCRAAQVVFDRVNRPAFLASVRAMGEMLVQGLKEIRSPLVTDVRGRGLLIGVELRVPVRPLIDRARANGLLVINAGDHVLRICPPLTIEEEHVRSALAILARCLQAMENEQ